MSKKQDLICDNCESEVTIIIQHTFETGIQFCPMCGSEIAVEEVE